MAKDENAEVIMEGRKDNIIHLAESLPGMDPGDPG